jgi:hypothetical protein
MLPPRGRNWQLIYPNHIMINAILGSGGIRLGINYSVLNEMKHSDQILKILGWKTIRLIQEIFVQ